jgi:hypothetical protein
MPSKQSGYSCQTVRGWALGNLKWLYLKEQQRKITDTVNSSERTVEARKRQLSETVRQKSQRLGYKEWWDRLSLKTYQ